MVGKTRKQKKGVMTIPQLRKAFEHMESFTGHLLSKTKDAGARRKAFQKEWTRVFHRSVDDKAANAYLTFEAKKHKKGNATRKNRRQNGGQMPPLDSAPLDYTTRPGIYGVHGNFPAYVTSGFDIYDKINMDSPRIGCGVENITPKIPAGLGSNEVNFQKGGKRRSNRSNRSRKARGGAFPTMSEFAQALEFRPMTSGVPSSVLYDAQTAFKGQALPPTPSPNTANPPYWTPPTQTLDAVVTTIKRDLGSEIRS